MTTNVARSTGHRFQTEFQSKLRARSVPAVRRESCSALVRDVLDQLHNRRRRQHSHDVERAGGYEAVSKRCRGLDRIELHPCEDLVRVVDASQHDVALCRLLPPDWICIESRLERVEVVGLEMVNHESHCASSARAAFTQTQ